VQEILLPLVLLKEIQGEQTHQVVVLEMVLEAVVQV
tara:strand:+ start:192 stop:299 length:108 start_codon:yes stop_codon:yes gene_type:complete